MIKGSKMLLTAKVYLIVTTTFVMVNGKTIDKMETSYVSGAQTYSECSNQIKSKKKRYDAERKRKRDNYSYSYKRITCKSKNVKLGENDALKQVFKIKW